MTGFEFSLRNFSLGAQQTAGHFFGRHFQRKHTDGQTLIAADVQRDIQSKSGFTHGRTTGDDDELTLMHTACHAVQIREAGTDTRDIARIVNF